ncbi:Cyclin-dependent kinase 9 [Nymphon striatum]|nr:Cyclin-dependent kinase 9 [Nymphon striatum]
MASVTNKSVKNPHMTDTERKELANKMDEDIESFINNLPKKKYEDGWKEDNWEEEFEKHPFFMSKQLEEGEELPPLLQGLQQLKYDSNENTPEELAENYKEDGNINFKNKKYKNAVKNYTVGIDQKCCNNLLNAQLYTNRATAHFNLGNYRSSLNDAASALTCKPDYIKAIHRGIQCCLKLSLFEDVISWANNGLSINPENKDFKEFKKDASRQLAVREVQRRKKERQDKKDEAIINLIQEKGITLANDEKISISPLDSLHPAAAGYRVRPDVSNKNLIWPVIIFYPEHGQSDFIHSFEENSKVIDVLKSMFMEKPTWDVENKYVPNNMEIFYEELNTETFVELNIKHTLAQILKNSSEVFKAKNKTKRNEFVALKKILMENEKEGFPITALREIKILQNLKHENVVQLKEICHANYAPNKYHFYLVFEFCEHDLAGILSNCNVRFSLGEIKMVMKQLLNGLYYIHSNRILHRDMKAANILLTKKGVLKLADFGLARVISPSSSQPNRYTNRVVTLWYRPPELLLGERNYGSPVDLWGAGCMMAEMWTRTPIMQGNTEQHQLALISQLCGSITADVWPAVTEYELFKNLELPQGQKRKVKERLKPYVKDQFALDLLDKLLILDPSRRIDSDSALNHDFFWTAPLPLDLAKMMSNYTQSMYEFLTPPRKKGHRPHNMPPNSQHPPLDGQYHDRVF